MGIGKRGVSPLIATVLLIMVVVSLGAAIMLVLKGVTNQNDGENLPDLSCNNVKMTIFNLNGELNICHNQVNKEINAIYNNGKVPINDLKFIAIGTTNIYNADSAALPLEVEDIKYHTFTYAGDIGELQQVKFIPVIYVNGRKIVCADNSLEININEVKSC